MKEEDKTYNNIEVLSSGGLQCDNTDCDYKDTTPEDDYKECVDKPCPKCGENLLTEEDYERSLVLRETINFMNTIDPEILKQMQDALTPESMQNMDFFKDAEGVEDLPEDTEFIKTTVTTHKDIKAIKVEKVDKKDKK